MEFRIGVNLGRMWWSEGDTIYGDGVNVAARLESLAEPEESVSPDVYENIKNTISLWVWVYWRASRLKNIKIQYAFIESYGARRQKVEKSLVVWWKVKRCWLWGVLVALVVIAAGWPSGSSTFAPLLRREVASKEKMAFPCRQTLYCRPPIRQYEWRPQTGVLSDG